MPMTLYNLNLSPYTSRVRIQIRAKGIENEIAIVQRPEPDAYKAINPTGKVPSLDTGANFILPESGVIAEFIEDSFPEPSLRGRTALSNAKVRLLARIADIYILPALTILFAQMQTRDPAKIEEGVAKLKEGLGFVETYLEGPRYAVENRLTLADCALAPALFFANATPTMFGQAPFAGNSAAKSYFDNLSEDAHVAQVMAEMGAAVREFMARSR